MEDDREILPAISAIPLNVMLKSKFCVIRDLFGHGVGKKVHEEPAIPILGSVVAGLFCNGNVLPWSRWFQWACKPLDAMMGGV